MITMVVVQDKHLSYNDLAPRLPGSVLCIVYPIPSRGADGGAGTCAISKGRAVSLLSPFRGHRTSDVGARKIRGSSDLLRLLESCGERDPAATPPRSRAAGG